MLGSNPSLLISFVSSSVESSRQSQHLLPGVTNELTGVKTLRSGVEVSAAVCRLLLRASLPRWHHPSLRGGGTLLTTQRQKLRPSNNYVSLHRRQQTTVQFHEREKEEKRIKGRTREKGRRRAGLVQGRPGLQAGFCLHGVPGCKAHQVYC